MRIRFRTRKLFCDNADCTRCVFAERLPDLVPPKRRSTPRLDRTLVRIGLECGGEPGSRLATHLGIPASGDTILRRLRASEVQPTDHSGRIGIDDFAFRRGVRYGTIIVDHTTGRPIDLLPDRQGASVTKWLADRPTPAIVTRDRSASYAAAIRAGAPDAVQVADRWHLLANAREAQVRVLDRHHRTVTQLAQRVHAESIAATASASTTVTAQPDGARSPTRRRRDDALSTAHRQRRLALFEQVRTLRHQGKSLRCIARELTLSKNTVARFLRSESFPERARPRRRRSVDPFADRLKQLWNAGERNARRLWRSIQSEGFAGPAYAVRRYVSAWRTEQERTHATGPRPAVAAARPVRPGSNRLAWLLIRDEIVRQPEEQKLATLIATECKPVAAAASLVRDFGDAIKEHDLAKLTGWMKAAAEPSVEQDIRNFAAGIQRDWPEIEAAVMHHYNNGRAEGHVNRLKLIKRKMYGRAKFDLLRIRVLASGP